MTKHELSQVSQIVREQWDHLRAWIEDNVDVHDPRPSVLEGWTVAELVAHLARAHRVIPMATADEAGLPAQSLAEYLGGYAGDAASIAEGTREQAREIAEDPLAALDRAAEQAWAALEAFGPADRVVIAKRGPIMLSDLVVTRGVEWVVHADDLARSVGATKPPVTRAALDLVAQALLDIVVTRGGWSLEVADALLWVRLAAGRQPYDVDELARALSPTYTADAVPDLGTVLPLL